MERLTVDEIVGANIRHLRRDAGLTQSQLARVLSFFGGERWSHQWVSVREKGKTPTTVAQACLIAYALGVSVAQLLIPNAESQTGEIALGRSLGAIVLEPDAYVLDLHTDPPGRVGDVQFDLPLRKKRALDDVYEQIGRHVDRADQLQAIAAAVEELDLLFNASQGSRSR